MYNDFTYDDLNRLTDVEYLDDVYDIESFTMDDLGNRTSAALRGETSQTYARNEETNRYDEIGTLTPLPFHLYGPTMDAIIPSGAQGTN